MCNCAYQCEEEKVAVLTKRTRRGSAEVCAMGVKEVRNMKKTNLGKEKEGNQSTFSAFV